jgi:hypothetical protein
LSSNRDVFNEYKNVLVDIKSTTMLKKKRKSQNDVQNLLSENVKDDNKEGDAEKEGNCNETKEKCGDMDIVIEINNNLDQELINNNNNNVIKTNNNNKNENVKSKSKTKVPKAKGSKKKNQEQDNKDNKDTLINEDNNNNNTKDIPIDEDVSDNINSSAKKNKNIPEKKEDKVSTHIHIYPFNLSHI